MGKFQTAFRRPLSYIVTPALGAASVATIVLGVPTGWNTSAVGAIARDAMAGNAEGIAGDIDALPSALMNGVTNAIPALAATVVAGVVGRAFKI